MPYAMLIGLFLLLSYGCTTVPSRFSRDGSTSDAGYRIENETNEGFSLEVFYVGYSFFPNPDSAVQEAKEYFIRTATEIAKRKGKTIIRPASAELHAAPTRNAMSGEYAVYVTGKIAHQSQP